MNFDAPSLVDSEPQCFVTTSKGNQKPIEFVGEMKIRSRKKLNVGLRLIIYSNIAFQYLQLSQKMAANFVSRQGNIEEL